MGQDHGGLGGIGGGGGGDHGGIERYKLGGIMINRITMMGKNATTTGERRFCQECLTERWKGYYFYFQEVNQEGFFVCDECLARAKRGGICD